MGGVHASPFTNFLISDFDLQDLRHLWLKCYIFQISGRYFPWHPKGGLYTPINLEVSFWDILATASRLNTFYGLETVQSSRHFGITKKVLRHIRHFWRIYDVINVRFFRHFAVFGYSKCHKVCRNSWFSHRICILIGSTTLPSLMCTA